MTDRQHSQASPPDSDQGKVRESRGTLPADQSPADRAAGVPSAGEAAASKKLTEDEQMALYEKELKENDWGHQPC
jgi:hypothetical protein